MWFATAFNIQTWCSSILFLSIRILMDGFNGFQRNQDQDLRWTCWWYYNVNFEFWDELLKIGCFAGSKVGSDDTALSPWFLLRIGYIRMLNMIVCLWPLVWLFSGKLSNSQWPRRVAFICSFVVLSLISETQACLLEVCSHGQMLSDFLHPWRSTLPLMISH